MLNMFSYAWDREREEEGGRAEKLIPILLGGSRGEGGGRVRVKGGMKQVGNISLGLTSRLN